MILFIFGEIIYILSCNRKIKFDISKSTSIVNVFYGACDKIENQSIHNLR